MNGHRFFSRNDSQVVGRLQGRDVRSEGWLKPYGKFFRHIRLLVISLLFLIPSLQVWGLTTVLAPARDATREKAITSELFAIAPEAVPDFVAATAAFDKGDFSTAITIYRRVLEKAPNFDAAMRRLGNCLMERNEHKESIALHERALLVRRSPENLSSFAESLVFKRKSKPPADDFIRARSLISEAIKLAPTDTDYLFIKASISLKLNDMPSFWAVYADMNRLAPDNMTTHYFAAIGAVIEEKWITAEREIREAGRLGFPPDAVQSFLDSGISSRARLWRWGFLGSSIIGLWILGLVLMFIVGKVLSVATLASIERDDPNKAISQDSHRLRAAYRRIVTMAGLYWYISLPFVAVIVVGATAGIIYGFMVAGQVPIKLVLFLVLGAAMSLYAIVRSLFIRIRDDADPGRAITEEDAPGLWAMTREVAAVVGTRPIDQIWFTVGTDLAVFERGSTSQRMKDQAPRALIIGAGVLEGFEQGAFRAVLAHEYGHFSHRDTAGGEVALRVRNGMMAFAIAVGKAGFAVWWNLSFQFLRLYNFLFCRISHGATRLQEVLADRVAIHHFGLEAFRNGLTHVIRRSIHFKKLTDDEINQAVEQKRGLANIYSLSAFSDDAVLVH